MENSPELQAIYMVIGYVAFSLSILAALAWRRWPGGGPIGTLDPMDEVDDSTTTK